MMNPKKDKRNRIDGATKKPNMVAILKMATNLTSEYSEGHYIEISCKYDKANK